MAVCFTQSDDLFHYFGFGSLVNEETRSEGCISALATLKGWRREWYITGGKLGQSVCALSIRLDPTCAIRGVLVEEPVTNLSHLDAREQLYNRLTLSSDSLAELGGVAPPNQFYAYKGDPKYSGWGKEGCPILLSYLDCVLAGFYRHWGKAGIDDFMATTDGWHVPILDDRSLPRYPRAVILPKKLEGLVDTALKSVNANILSLDA